MLIDTVGLIRRLPHKLVEAFKSTLEAAAEATLILNVCDASDENCSEHLEVTKSLLDELGCANTPIVSVMNKCDLVGNIYSMPTFGNTVLISALHKKGIDQLLDTIMKLLPQTRREVQLLIPYQFGAEAALVREECTVLEEDYREDGVYFRAIVDISLLDRFKDRLLSD